MSKLKGKDGKEWCAYDKKEVTFFFPPKWALRNDNKQNDVLIFQRSLKIREKARNAKHSSATVIITKVC